MEDDTWPPPTIPTGTEADRIDALIDALERAQTPPGPQRPGWLVWWWRVWYRLR